MEPAQTQDATVSFDDEALIIVDSQDRILGHGNKAKLHEGAGTLHRAFSIFLFNDQGEVLLQQRSHQKRLWPLFWSNTCCSHPRQGESYGVATRRRLNEELGMTSDLIFTHRFRYQAQFDEWGAEHELCSVYVGKAHGDPAVNPREIADWQWVTPHALDAWIEKTPETLTPWLKMEWQALRSGDHHSALTQLGLAGLLT